nr:MAG TPA: hypothetical protein [Caudoviricetes sp.]
MDFFFNLNIYYPSYTYILLKIKKRKPKPRKFK